MGKPIIFGAALALLLSLCIPVWAQDKAQKKFLLPMKQYIMCTEDVRMFESEAQNSTWKETLHGAGLNSFDNVVGFWLSEDKRNFSITLTVLDEDHKERMICMLASGVNWTFRDPAESSSEK